MRAAIGNWGPRFIANGIDYNDFVRTTSELTRWEDWIGAWTATAESHLALATEASDRGNRQSAGEA